MDKQSTSANIPSDLRTIELAPYGDKGGQGKVYRTNHQRYLIKVWDPFEMPRNVQAARLEAKRKFRTFSRLRFSCESELRCLPLDYREIDTQPAYVMQCAEGFDMAEEWKNLQELGLAQRLRICKSAADGLSVLHGRMVVHADIKLDNLFFDPRSDSVAILDLDGGGYCGKEPNTDQFAPSAIPGPLFMPPDMLKMGALAGRNPWPGIWTREDRRKQPDLWALAVLIYLILTDERPFPKESFGDKWFVNEDPEWPVEAQRARFAQIGIRDELIRLFCQTFGSRNRTQTNYRCIDARTWSGVLGKILAVSQPSAVECPKCHARFTHVSYSFCPKCSEQGLMTALWGYATCPMEHRTPAKSPGMERVFCIHCGREVKRDHL